MTQPGKHDAADDRRSEWKFEIAGEGWIWTVKHPDGTTERSATLPTLKECIDDATARGYVAVKPEDERRHDLVLPVAEILKKR